MSDIREQVRASAASGGPIFRPCKRGKDKPRHINLTLTPEQYARLEVIASRAGVTLRDLARQCVEFALDHIEKGAI